MYGDHTKNIRKQFCHLGLLVLLEWLCLLLYPVLMIVISGLITGDVAMAILSGSQVILLIVLGFLFSKLGGTINDLVLWVTFLMAIVIMYLLPHQLVISMVVLVVVSLGLLLIMQYETKRRLDAKSI